MNRQTLRRLAPLAFLLASIANAQTFGVVLKGTNETPTIGDPRASGFAVVTLSGLTVSYTIFAQGTGTITAGHIHEGDKFTAGSVRIPFTSIAFVDGVATGTVAIPTQAIADGIRARPSGYYVNLHTADFPGGVIRGELSPLDMNRLYFPTVVKADGLNNTSFVTDLSLVNVSTGTMVATIDFYASSATALTAPTATKTVSIPGSSQTVVTDLLGSTFSATGDGALRVSAPLDVHVTSRVLNDLRSKGQGTQSLLVPPSELADGVGTGILPLLSQAAAGDIAAGNGFRTNIGYFNPLASEVTATFVARRKSDGAVIGTKEVKVPSLSRQQKAVFDLIDTVEDADRVQDDFHVTYSLAKGGTLLVYAAVVDNRTGDGVYIPGRRVR